MNDSLSFRFYCQGRHMHFIATTLAVRSGVCNGIKIRAQCPTMYFEEMYHFLAVDRGDVIPICKLENGKRGLQRPLTALKSSWTDRKFL